MGLGSASRTEPPGRGSRDPAHERTLGEQGRETLRRLLAAGQAEFGERGFQAATVDGVARRAGTSHGTFYLYFASKDDLFGVLAQQALADVDRLADEFPVVTPDAAGQAALRRWIGAFCGTYTAHAGVIRLLSQADVVREDIWESGLKVLFHLAEAVSWGMTAPAARLEGAPVHSPDATVRLTGLACLIMLERVNYLLDAGVGLPPREMADRLTAIVFAAFQPGTRQAAERDRS